MKRLLRPFLIFTVVLSAMPLLPLPPSTTHAADWIWSPAHQLEEVPRTSCHFRKQFSVAHPEKAEITITADDRYELYVNGRRIGKGQSTETLDKYDISRLVRNGRNLIAIKVTNTAGNTAAVAAHVLVRDQDDTLHNFSTDESWSTNLSPLPLWYTLLYNDSRWDTAQSFGALGSTPPWDEPAAPRESVATVVDETDTSPAGLGSTTPESVEEIASESEEPEYRVEEVLGDSKTGSLVALTFNEFGHAIAARENGELLLIHDTDGDQILDEVRVYCDEVTRCQGILCLNGNVYVTGEGPKGLGLYRLADRNRDGQLEEVKLLLAFDGEGGEYGPHGIVLGSDGFLYISLGSKTRPVSPYAVNSPYSDFYEGDLVQPRSENPDSSEIPAPCGAIVRVNLSGDKLQIVAGGLANAYDLAFDREGNLFTFDADTEQDLGAPWYRPTALYHVTAGAEFGWRSGWAKWPDYFVDRTPAVLDAGRGAPTGMVFYNHFKFPEEYHGALFVGDWKQGRITAIKTKRNGSSYSANTELFMEEEDLHVTDLAIGPDGWLYFVTGGRGEPGGLFRIRWTGKQAAGADDLGEGLSAVIRQPQMDAAWARQKIAATRVDLSTDWNRMVQGVAMSSANPWYYRIRALNLMQLYGPTPTTDLLTALAEDSNERLRAKAAELMGIHANADTQAALVLLLQDTDRRVRRIACESMLRSEQTTDPENLTDLLRSDDVWEATAARRLLQTLPVDRWEHLLDSDDHRLVIQSGIAMMAAEPTKDNALRVISRLQTLMAEFITDRDFIDMLRVMQVAISRGQVAPGEASTLSNLLAEEFPSGNLRMNRELVRLLTYLQATQIMDRYIAQLNADDIPEVEKLHLALYLARIQHAWQPAERIAIMDYLDLAQHAHHSHELGDFVAVVNQEFIAGMSEQEVQQVLAQGATRPTAAFNLLYRLPETLDPATFEVLTTLDSQLLDKTTVEYQRLKIGIVAVLARSGDSASMQHLRQQWDRDPERRPALAMGLAQSGEPENWEFLLRSLPIIEDAAAREVLTKLQEFESKPDQPEPYRHVILKAELLGEDGGPLALELLQHWTGQTLAEDGDWQARLAAWKAWYAESFPEALPAEMPVSQADSRWEYTQLVHDLTGHHALAGSAINGTYVFTDAGCARCHRVRQTGGDIGPDLSHVGQRLMKKEIVQAMLHPSHRIASRYRSEVVITRQGQPDSGRSLPDGSTFRVTVEQPDGAESEVPEEPVETVRTVKASEMPNGLLEGLSLQQIADLLAYLLAPTHPRIADESPQPVAR